MGWRDRDYAKFRTDEFEAIYGRTGDAVNVTDTKRGASPMMSADTKRRKRRRSPSGRGTRVLRRVLRIPALAVVVTAAVMVLLVVSGNVENFNRGVEHQPTLVSPTITPAPVHVLPVPQPSLDRTPTRTTRITGTRLLSYGGSMTLSGSHTKMSGSIVVSGRWNAGAWATFAVARGDRTTYSIRIPLERRGVLSIRIAYPDGARAVGTYQVR